MPRIELHWPKRRTQLAAGAVCAGVLAVVLSLTAFSGGAGTGVTYLDGKTSAVYYHPGHRHKAPDFSGATLAGAPVHLSGYRGGVVVLNFWGSWCGACRSEAATLAVVAEQYRNAGVRFLGVDEQDNTAGALAFQRDHGIPYPSVSDPNDLVALDLGSVVPMSATPTTVVVDAAGDVAGAVFGAGSYSQLTTLLHKVTGKS